MVDRRGTEKAGCNMKLLRKAIGRAIRDRSRIPRCGRWVLFANLALALSSQLFAADAPPDGFEPLFNGVDLTGWHGLGHFDPRTWAEMSETERADKRRTDWEDLQAHWYVEDGEIVNDGQGPYLTTDRDFGDIELSLEYKTVALADSGVYLRATPQVQIWDFTEAGGKWELGADKGSGGLWNNSPGAAGKDPLTLADKPFGEWNQLRILQVGVRTSVWLNHQLVVDHAIMENYWDRQRPLFATGPIQLQTHGGEIRWRNIFVREIGAVEANGILADKHAAGFEPVFNGQDLNGWSGPVEDYQVVDGRLLCRPRTGGTIFTESEFDNFVARLQFKLPPGANNGLAIRYPGHGDAAYTGMCELQILDDDSPNYAQLEPRQFHGSAYGMVAAHRGYLRPVGVWNFQEVTVKESTIRVELNGYVILDTDLAEVTDYLDDAAHPGKGLRRGHFGFCGHGYPVEFRDVMIRPLAATKE